MVLLEIFVSCVVFTAVVWLFCYIVSPSRKVLKRREKRKQLKTFKKGTILKKVGSNPFSDTEYIYVVDVRENEDGDVYLKTFLCDENGDCLAGSAERVDEARWYAPEGWKILKNK